MAIKKSSYEMQQNETDLGHKQNKQTWHVVPFKHLKKLGTFLLC